MGANQEITVLSWAHSDHKHGGLTWEGLDSCKDESPAEGPASSKKWLLSQCQYKQSGQWVELDFWLGMGSGKWSSSLLRSLLANILLFQIWLCVCFQYLFLSQALVRHQSLPKMTFVSSTLCFLSLPFHLLFFFLYNAPYNRAPPTATGSCVTAIIWTLRSDSLSCVTLRKLFPASSSVKWEQ